MQTETDGDYTDPYMIPKDALTYQKSKGSVFAKNGVSVSGYKLGIKGGGYNLAASNTYAMAAMFFRFLEINQTTYEPVNTSIVSGTKMSFRIHGVICYHDADFSVIDTYLTIIYNGSGSWGVTYTTLGDSQFKVSLSPNHGNKGTMTIVIGPGTSQESYENLLANYKACRYCYVRIDHLGSSIGQAGATDELVSLIENTANWALGGYTVDTTKTWQNVKDGLFEYQYIEGTRLSSSDTPSILVTAEYTYDGGGHYTFTGYSVSGPTVSELYNYAQTSGNRTINFNFADQGEYGLDDSIQACVGAIGFFNDETPPTAVTIIAHLPQGGVNVSDFYINLTNDASTTTVTKTVYSSVTSISSSSTNNQYPTAKAVYDLTKQSSPSGCVAFQTSQGSDIVLYTDSTTSTWDGTIEYSTDGSTWQTWDGTTIQANNGKLYLRGIGNTYLTGGYGTDSWHFTSAGAYDGIICSGNIENLLDYKLVIAGIHPTMDSYCYAHLFDNSTIGDASKLELPATTLTGHCYYYMFSSCTSLTAAPALLATTLADSCYESMFENCTSLTTAPALPATTLASYCYEHMFHDCMSLRTLPYLGVQILEEECYSHMFRGCSSIKLSTTQTGEYQIQYRIPGEGTGTVGSASLKNMFSDTGGTFSSTPTINTTYWLSTSNKIVYPEGKGYVSVDGDTVRGDITLAAPVNNNSPALIFQRGVLNDNYNDWRIQDRGGFLRFDQRGLGSTSWSEIAYINTTGTVYSAAFSGSGASLTSLNASNISSGTLADARLPSTVEKVANKVTSITSSSTDTQYPTAKAVYDLFASITDADNTSY